MRNLYTQKGIVRWRQVLMLMTIVVISGAVAGALAALHFSKRNHVMAQAKVQAKVQVGSVAAALTAPSSLKVQGEMNQAIGFSVSKVFASEISYAAEAYVAFQSVDSMSVSLFNSPISASGHLVFPAVDVSQLLGEAEGEARADLHVPVTLKLVLTGKPADLNTLVTYQGKQFLVGDEQVEFKVAGDIRGAARANIEQAADVAARYITQVDFSSQPFAVESALVPVKASLTNHVVKQ